MRRREEGRCREVEKADYRGRDTSPSKHEKGSMQLEGSVVAYGGEGRCGDATSNSVEHELLFLGVLLRKDPQLGDHQLPS